MPSTSRSNRLSRGEERLYKLIPAKGKRTTKWLAAAFYKGRSAPEHHQQVIINMVRALERKGMIERSAQAGPHPTEVWRRP